MVVNNDTVVAQDINDRLLDIMAKDEFVRPWRVAKYYIIMTHGLFGMVVGKYLGPSWRRYIR